MQVEQSCNESTIKFKGLLKKERVRGFLLCGSNIIKGFHTLETVIEVFIIATFKVLHGIWYILLLTVLQDITRVTVNMYISLVSRKFGLKS